MKKYLVLYRSPIPASQQMAGATAEQAKAGMDAWMSWAKRAGSAIVDMGAPLGDPVVLAGKAAGGQHVGGYGVVQVKSIEEAKQLFSGHPHLMLPGASIEILEQLSMPGM